MSNIVGPVMLLGRTSPALGWDRFGIYALMNAVGLINETRHTKHVAEDPAPDSRSALPWLRMGDVGEDPGGSLGAWERGLEAIHPLLGRESVDVIVVDDHAWGDGGWAEVVCRAVGAQWIEPDPAVYAADAEPVLVGQRAESGATVYGTSRPDVLLGMIDGRDRRFACDVLGGKGSLSGAQILLLDLRLFSGRDDAREVAFFKSLLKMARLFEVESPTSRARATDGATLPWPGFATSELADIQAWLDSPGPKRETAHYFKALTLLPRLLALTDLSLPIVLFSSTGRREITDMLVPYGNIITAFEKPRFLGATDVDMAVETSDKFRTAMGRAMELLAARLVCVRLHRLRRTEQVERVPAENAPGAATVGWTVELLVDETGEERRGHLTVGGLLVVIPPGHDCSGAEAIIRAEAAKSPGRALKDRIRQQRSEIAVALERWSATAGVALGVVAVRGEIARSLFSSEGQADPLFDERVADNLHRYLLQVILELAVFHKARQVIPRPAWDRTVFNYRIGTRIWKPVSREFGRAMWEKWGVETRAVGTVGELARALSHLERYLRARDRDATADDILNQLLEVLRQYLPTADVAMAVPLIDPGDARPIVESVKRRYLRSRFDPQSDVARAYHLNSESSGASLLHLYADGVLGHRWDKLPAGLREIGFQTDLDDALEDILASLRLYLHGRWAEAIAGAAWTLSGSVSMPAGSIIPSLLPDLAAAAAELSGEDNLTLARSLVSDPDSLRPPVVPPSTTFQGNVESKGPNSLWIQDAVTRRRYISFPFGSRGWSSLRPGDRVEFHVVRSEAPGRFQAVDVCKSTCPAGCGADTF